MEQKQRDLEKARFNSLLLSTEREGIHNLIDHLHSIGFYDQPASTSTSKHNACVGGLVNHSLNVWDNAFMVLDAFKLHKKDQIPPIDSIIIAALLHDIGKAGWNGNKGYVDNVLKSGKISTSKPYEVNKDLISIPHQDLSVYIALQFIDLTDEEIVAIKYHNGLYTSEGRDIKGKETPLMLLIHFADMWAARVTESIDD